MFGGGSGDEIWIFFVVLIWEEVIYFSHDFFSQTRPFEHYGKNRVWEVTGVVSLLSPSLLTPITQEKSSVVKSSCRKL